MELKMKRKKAQKVKAIHYQATWDIIHALEVVEEWEKRHGGIAEKLPYIEQCKIYKGNLLPAIHFGKIGTYQNYGVKFYCEFYINSDPDNIIKYTNSYRIKEPMTIKELIDGCERVNVDMGNGLTVKGWKGASHAWLDEIGHDFGHDITWIKATAEANCLVKP